MSDDPATLTSEIQQLARRNAELTRLLDAERTAARVQLARSASAYAALVAQLSAVTEELAKRRAGTDDERVHAAELAALHDPLTGLLNRRGFYGVAENLLSVARTQRLAGVVIFLDVDGLKSINDDHGHAAGDKLLCAAAEVLATCFRAGDAVGRLGGDEFVVLAAGAPVHEVGTITSRLADAVESSNLRRAPEPALAWSVGVVTFGPEPVNGLDALMVDADHQMYRAKRESGVHRIAAGRRA